MAKSVPSFGTDRKIVIPDKVDMTLEEFEAIYPEWLRRQATDRKHLPVRGGLRDQPAGLMDGLLFLDGLFDNLIELNRPKPDAKG